MDKFHRNPMQMPSTSEAKFDDAFAELKQRELLYNRDKKELGIKIGDKLIIPKPRVDEFNVTYNEDDEIALKDDVTVDSVTARADRQGVDWKSQTLLAETTEERTIILICVKDNDRETGMVGFFGGEIVELGEDVESHYQVSLTSTGSRLIKGATTNKKKAKPCFVKYNGDYYYGLHFKESSPAKIYHAGWSNIPGPLAAPSYTTYTDGDFSEIVDLDDDSETGTEVIEFEFLTYDDISWEFLTAPYVRTEASSSAQYYSSQQNLTRRTDFKGVGTTQFGTGYAHNQRYYGLHWYDKINYTYNGNSWNVTHGITFGSDTRGSYIQSTSAGVAGYISIPGNYKGEIGFYVYNNTSSARNFRLFNIQADRFQGIEAADYVSVPAYTAQWVMFRDLPAGEYYFYQSGTFRYYSVYQSYTTITETIRDASWSQNGNNKDYSLTNGLKISSSKDTSWFEDTSAGNAGYIDFAEAGGQTDPAMTLAVLGKASIKVGFTSIDGNNTNIRISETLDTSDRKWNSSVSVDNSSTTSIKECVYNYNGVPGEIYIMNEVGPVRILYVEIDYDDATNIIYEIIKNLPDTGEDGSPHIIRPSGVIDKATLMTIAGVSLNSERQLIIDLSKCTAAADAQDWSGDSDLSKAFQGCSSLRKFMYPKGVTTAGEAPFLNCSFLRDIEFNDEMRQFGYSGWVNKNQGFFSGARIKEVWLPKQLGKVTGIHGWGGYIMAQNNVVSLYIRPDSYYAQNNVSIVNIFTNSDWGGSAHQFWSTWNYSRGDFKIYLPCKRIGSPEDNNWETGNQWLYNRWMNEVGDTTFGAVMNEELSSITNNVPSLSKTSKVKDFLAPYDVNEMWYEPRGLDLV